MSCFPHVESKDFLRSNQIESDEEKLKVDLGIAIGIYHFHISICSLS